MAPRKLPAGISFHKATGRYIGRFVFRAKGQPPKRATVYGKTVAECQRAMTNKRVELEKATPEGAARLTVGEYLTQWLDEKRDGWAEGTLAKNRHQVEAKLIPYLGHIRLADLAKNHVVEMLGALRDVGAGPHSRAEAFKTLRAALNSALDDELIEKDPCRTVTAPKLPKREMSVWTPEQAQAFLEAARSDRLYALYVLAVQGGMRQGELLGLRWKDVDWDARAVCVQVSLARSRKLKNTKTDGSVRQIDLPPACMAELAAHRKRMEAERHRSPYVFPDQSGNLQSQGNFYNRSYLPLFEPCGAPGGCERCTGDPAKDGPPRPYPRIRFNDIRHTHATGLLKAGIQAKVVQERLGHSRIGTTMDVYAHVLPTMQKEAAEASGRLFGEGPPAVASEPAAAEGAIGPAME